MRHARGIHSQMRIPHYLDLAKHLDMSFMSPSLTVWELGGSTFSYCFQWGRNNTIFWTFLEKI